MTEKRVAIVTGGSRGIGAAIVRRLAGDGLHVVAIARNQEKLAQVCGEVTASGGAAEALVCDIADAKALGSAVESIAERLGRIDVEGDRNNNRVMDAIAKHDRPVPRFDAIQKIVRPPGI